MAGVSELPLLPSWGPGGSRWLVTGREPRLFRLQNGLVVCQFLASRSNGAAHISEEFSAGLCPEMDLVASATQCKGFLRSFERLFLPDLWKNARL